MLNCRARVKRREDEDIRFTQLRDLKANLLDRVVDIKGTVIRVSNVRPMCTWLTFKCAKCGSFVSAEQPEGVYTEPKKCLTKSCKSNPTFVPNRSHPQTLTVDWQSIRVQETVPAEKGRTFIKDMSSGKTCIFNDEHT